MIKAVSALNTSGRFDDTVYQKTIGQNGVDLKATNALFSDFAQWRFAQLISPIYYLEIV